MERVRWRVVAGRGRWVGRWTGWGGWGDGVTQDCGGGAAGGFDAGASGGGAGGRVEHVLVEEQGEAVVEGADGLRGPLCAEDAGAVGGEGGDGIEAAADVGLVVPGGEGRHGEAVVAGDFDELFVGVEEGLDEAVVEVGRVGRGRAGRGRAGLGTWPGGRTVGWHGVTLPLAASGAAMGSMPVCLAFVKGINGRDSRSGRIVKRLAIDERGCRVPGRCFRRMKIESRASIR